MPAIRDKRKPGCTLRAPNIETCCGIYSCYYECSECGFDYSEDLHNKTPQLCPECGAENEATEEYLNNHVPCACNYYGYRRDESGL